MEGRVIAYMYFCLCFSTFTHTFVLFLHVVICKGEILLLSFTLRTMYLEHRFRNNLYCYFQTAKFLGSYDSIIGFISTPSLSVIFGAC
jgi:hypothetical protein